GQWGSALGLAVVLLSVGKTWWDSRVNLISGLALLVGLTAAYAAIKHWRRDRVIGDGLNPPTIQ
ncbi:MAG TPA: hypothetical protein VIM36_12210, partial [Gemmatimonadaceae bacterium]